MAKRACVFVDGENFRHSIGDLFEQFNPHDYLPKGAHWESFFDWLVQEVSSSATERLRTYWYVIEHIDFFPAFFRDPKHHPQKRREFYIKHSQEYKRELENLSNANLIAKLTEITQTLQARTSSIEKRFGGWQFIHNTIAAKHKSVEFRREGGLGYDLFRERFGREKGVDVKLAVDLLTLRSAYDLAVIVSGDQDYVPAVKVAKDSGKEVVNVSFRRRNGTILPGRAKRLDEAADWSYVVSYEEFRKYLDL